MEERISEEVLADRKRAEMEKYFKRHWKNKVEKIDRKSDKSYALIHYTEKYIIHGVRTGRDDEGRYFEFYHEVEVRGMDYDKSPCLGIPSKKGTPVTHTNAFEVIAIYDPDTKIIKVYEEKYYAFFNKMGKDFNWNVIIKAWTETQTYDGLVGDPNSEGQLMEIRYAKEK